MCFRYTTKRSREATEWTRRASGPRRRSSSQWTFPSPPTSLLSVRAIGFEPTISSPPARRDTGLRYALPSSNDACGIRPHLASLTFSSMRGLATSPEVERAVCVGVPFLCSCEPDRFGSRHEGARHLLSRIFGQAPVFVATEALQRPTPLCSSFASGQRWPFACGKQKARCPLRDTGLWKARGRLKADVTCAGDTNRIRANPARSANLYSPHSDRVRSESLKTGQQLSAGDRNTRIVLRPDSPRSATNRKRTLSYRPVCNRTSAVKAS